MQEYGRCASWYVFIPEIFCIELEMGDKYASGQIRERALEIVVLHYLCGENKGIDKFCDTAKLICYFVFAYAKSQFSKDTAHMFNYFMYCIFLTCFFFLDYVDKLIDEVLERRETLPTYKASRAELQQILAKTPKPVSSKYGQYNKEEVVSAHTSRFKLLD